MDWKAFSAKVEKSVVYLPIFIIKIMVGAFLYCILFYSCMVAAVITTGGGWSRNAPEWVFDICLFLIPLIGIVLILYVLNVILNKKQYKIFPDLFLYYIPFMSIAILINFLDYKNIYKMNFTSQCLMVSVIANLIRELYYILCGKKPCGTCKP